MKEKYLRSIGVVDSSTDDGSDETDMTSKIAEIGRLKKQLAATETRARARDVWTRVRRRRVRVCVVRGVCDVRVCRVCVCDAT